MCNAVDCKYELLLLVEAIANGAGIAFAPSLALAGPPNEPIAIIVAALPMCCWPSFALGAGKSMNGWVALK